MLIEMRPVPSLRIAWRNPDVARGGQFGSIPAVAERVDQLNGREHALLLQTDLRLPRLKVSRARNHDIQIRIEAGRVSGSRVRRRESGVKRGYLPPAGRRSGPPAGKRPRSDRRRRAPPSISVSTSDGPAGQKRLGGATGVFLLRAKHAGVERLRSRGLISGFRLRHVFIFGKAGAQQTPVQFQRFGIVGDDRIQQERERVLRPTAHHSSRICFQANIARMSWRRSRRPRELAQLKLGLAQSRPAP